MNKLINIAASALLASAIVSPSANATDFSATFSSTNATVTADGTQYTTQGIPFIHKNNVYVPLDDILKTTGFTLGWDNDKCAVAAFKGDQYSYIGVNSNKLWINDICYTADAPTLIYNDVLYMPLIMYAQLSDSSIYFDGQLQTIKLGRRDLLTDTTVTDFYRLPYNNVSTYKAITFIGTKGMEILSIPDDQAKKYAYTVNAVASAMPSNVNVYNIAVPTSCEFYAPKQLYKNQLKGIRTIYSNLDERVIPINAVRPLMDHAAEKIYFDTDHHWTQRGAYYVYREYAEICGFDLPALESFSKKDSWSHVGSFAAFTKGTYGETIMRNNPELLERFIPKTDSKGTAYTDMYMTKKYADPVAVNTSCNSYVAFMGGDCPVSKFVTSTKNGRKLCIIKESYGNAFATWALNNYEEIYIIDPREFNGFNGHNAKFKLGEFYNMTHFDDLVIINYPCSLTSSAYRNSILNML